MAFVMGAPLGEVYLVNPTNITLKCPMCDEVDTAGYIFGTKGIFGSLNIIAVLSAL